MEQLTSPHTRPIRPGPRRGRCYDPNGWEQIDAFYVEEQFGPFTQWVAVPLTAPLLLHTPSDPGSPEPARDLVCPGGAAKYPGPGLSGRVSADEPGSSVLCG